MGCHGCIPPIAFGPFLSAALSHLFPFWYCLNFTPYYLIYTLFLHYCHILHLTMFRFIFLFPFHSWFNLSPMHHYHRFIFQYHIITLYSIYRLIFRLFKIDFTLYLNYSLYLKYLHWVFIFFQPLILLSPNFNVTSHHILSIDIRPILILLHIWFISIG